MTERFVTGQVTADPAGLPAVVRGIHPAAVARAVGVPVLIRMHVTGLSVNTTALASTVFVGALTDMAEIIAKSNRNVSRMRIARTVKYVRIMNVFVRPWIHRRNVKKLLLLKGRATNLQTCRMGQSVQQMIIKAVFVQQVHA